MIENKEGGYLSFSKVKKLSISEDKTRFRAFLGRHLNMVAYN